MRLLSPFAFLLLGCADAAPPAAPGPGPPAAAAPGDSLVLTTASGHQIWLAEGREGKSAAGGACYERSVEIRTDSTRIKVPLLYVTAAPVPAGAGFVRAELSRDCAPMASYRVELATGRPTRIEER